MKRLFISLALLFSFTDPGLSNVLRIGIKGELQGPEPITVFESDLLVTPGKTLEVFTGPYTAKLTPTIEAPKKYSLDIELLSLGPDYDVFRQSLDLAVGEKTVIPFLPVKNDVTVSYIVALKDDTSAFFTAEYPLSDTAKWGVSASIHYLTQWVKGSLADFRWNIKVGYLEDIYDRYRTSFKLSMFDKIRLVFHPTFADEVYLDPNSFYAILPHSARIDLVFGHETDAATPAPAAELLIYRLWGYGPRWMVIGLAHYFDDSRLLMRKYVDALNTDLILTDLPYDQWVNSDTGAIFCGAFVNWLIDTHGLSEFKNLYRESTPVDFEPFFEKRYGFSLRTAVGGFFEFIRNYHPRKGELEYYASIELSQNRIEKAREFYAEAVTGSDSSGVENLRSLSACNFWLGEYDQARGNYEKLIEITYSEPRFLVSLGDIQLILGEFDSGIKTYEEALINSMFSPAGLRLATILIDRGLLDSADVILHGLKREITGEPDYLIETARLMMAQGRGDVDSILTQATAKAANRIIAAPQDALAYLESGKAYALMGEFDRAEANLNTAFFLDSGVHFQSLALLELGRMFDLKGDREKARDYYHKAADGGGGQYLKSLAQKYMLVRYRPGK